MKLPLNTWSNYTRPSGWATDDTACYDTDENYVTDKIQMERLNLNITGENYWLASRVMNSNSLYATFHIRYVDTIGNVVKDDMCSVFNTGAINGSSHIYGLRPCFLLKNNITIIGGDGKTEDTAYIIG